MASLGWRQSRVERERERKETLTDRVIKCTAGHKKALRGARLRHFSSSSHVGGYKRGPDIFFSAGNHVRNVPTSISFSLPRNNIKVGWLVDSVSVAGFGSVGRPVGRGTV